MGIAVSADFLAALVALPVGFSAPQPLSSITVARVLRDASLAGSSVFFMDNWTVKQAGMLPNGRTERDVWANRCLCSLGLSRHQPRSDELSRFSLQQNHNLLRMLVALERHS